MNLEIKLEAILFYKGEAVSIKQLSNFLGESEEVVTESLASLKGKLSERGIRLVKNGGRVMLGTAPELHGIIEKLNKEETSREIGKAGLETLSIVLYRGPVRKSEIDYIRGVNSASILRNLMIRGLVERKNSEDNQRSYLYYPTFDLLSFMGITDVDELPEFEKIRKQIDLEVESEGEGESEG